jgi:hypothetical protein
VIRSQRQVPKLLAALTVLSALAWALCRLLA